MAEEKQMTEQESLQLITEMINKAKGHYQESGTGPILWGTVVGIAGLVSFAEHYWHFSIGFDIWWIVFLAFIPQIVISVREGKQKKTVAYQEAYLNTIWLVFGISIFMLTFYFNVIPGASERLMAGDNQQVWIKNTATGELKQSRPFILSAQSLLLLLYAMPTLATGIAQRFKPMVIAGIVCYGMFILSCFLSSTWDLLLNGVAGILNWLIPGLILRARYLKGKSC
ncbi:hypothetical protein [Sediminibacterium soli]|uniref:hypothetical protein n=1 Tax=Sediminibacterium soli TaxID=2698829 RepID=UPI00137A3531|nr:hypothetical protein [Sediminibacterium soli]NCI45485.1 hypothetical protein [Sediminibacterium soli]